MIKILIVEDDIKLNQIIASFLIENGFQVESSFNGEEALIKMAEGMIDLVVSDIMMPIMDGFELATLVRQEDKIIPILFLTAREDMMAKQRGFRLGIDDYLVKPVDMDELILHIQALLRRANIQNEKKLIVGDLIINADERTVILKNEEIPMTTREFNVLFKLLSYPKKTFTRHQLMDEFWGFETDSTSRTIDVHITKIREKLAQSKDFEIVTVHGLGYKALIKNNE